MALFYFISFDCKEKRIVELHKLIAEAVEWMKTREDFTDCYHGMYKICSGSSREYEMVLSTNDWSVLDRLNETAKSYIQQFCELTKNRMIVIGKRM